MVFGDGTVSVLMPLRSGVDGLRGRVEEEKVEERKESSSGVTL